MDRVTSVFYLHGFASSPRSTKAGYFAERLRRHGLTLQTPDFNEPDFRTLTMTRMLESIDLALGRSPSRAALIGSSLGGTLAVLAAARFPGRVDRLVLLAPAVMFARAGHHLLPRGRVQEWRQRGALPFFHYAYDADRLLDVAFYEDSLAHDAFGADFAQPTVIFQGLHDRSVDCRTVEAFANARPNVILSLLDDDHQLVASLPGIWQDVEPFLGLTD